LPAYAFAGAAPAGCAPSDLPHCSSILADTGTTLQNQVASILVDTGTTLQALFKPMAVVMVPCTRSRSQSL
jgi:hypothetical protein